MNSDTTVAYKNFTEILLEEKKLFAYNTVFNIKGGHDEVAEEIYNIIWEPKKAYKDNKEMPWGTWLIDCVFPRYLYAENNFDLGELIKDERFYYKPTFNKRESCHSHVGRMARPRITNKNYIGFLDFAIDRWKRSTKKLPYRSHPHFYFDVEEPSWIYAELFKNKKQIKTGRTATTCTANFAFRWDSKKEEPWVYQIMKHSQWHHAFGDFYGTPLLLRAFNKAVGLPKDVGNCCIFFVSASLDFPKKAREVIRWWNLMIESS